jgi:DHA1 family tetracycline resistance protein-like MFS transporter
MAGWLLAAFPLAQFFCTPILGQLSDRFGRGKILALSIGGTALSYVLFAFGIYNKSLTLLFVSRIIDGVSGGNISVAQAVIGDISQPRDRAKNFGLIGVAFGVGFILGPFVGGKLSDPLLVSWFNVATPFWIAAILSIFNMLLVLRFLPETLKVKSSKLIDITRPFNNLQKAFLYVKIRDVVIAIFLFNAGFTFFTTFWGIVLADQYGFTQGRIGNYFAYIGIMIVLAQGLVVRRLSGRVQDYKVLHYSIIGVGVCLLMYYLVPKGNDIWLYYIPPFLALFSALTRAFSSALLTRVAPDAILGEVMGISSSATALAQAIPAVLAGYIATGHASLPVLVGAIVTIFGGVLFIRTFKSK